MSWFILGALCVILWHVTKRLELPVNLRLENHLCAWKVALVKKTFPCHIQLNKDTVETNLPNIEKEIWYLLKWTADMERWLCQKMSLHIELPAGVSHQAAKYVLCLTRRFPGVQFSLKDEWAGSNS